jgi:hypothetical protein
MARYGDAGDYAPDNVRIITFEENSAERDRSKMHYVHTPAHCAQISARMRGHQWNVGSKRSDASRARMKAAQIERRAREREASP